MGEPPTTDPKALGYAPVAPAARPKVTFSLLWEIIVFPFLVVCGLVVLAVAVYCWESAGPTLGAAVMCSLIVLAGLGIIADAVIRLWMAIRQLRGLPRPTSGLYPIWCSLHRRLRF